MANKIAEIGVLEELISKRYHESGGEKVEIGHFWSVLQIYYCMKNVGVSLNTLCKVASMFDGRLDSKYRPDRSPIGVAMMRKYLHLESSPAQCSHTVITKTMSRGIDRAETIEDLSKVLTKHNSFGPEILKDICRVVDDKRGRLTDTRFSVMGNSGFSQVLKLCLVLTELQKSGIITDMSDIKPSDHLEYIIKTIQENQSNVRSIEELGVSISSM